MNNKKRTSIYEILNKAIFNSLVVLVSATNAAINVSSIPSNFKKSNNTTGDIIIITKEFYSRTNKCTIEEKSNEGIYRSLCIKKTRTRKYRGKTTCY